jgi:hypothetical protein
MENFTASLILFFSIDTSLLYHKRNHEGDETHLWYSHNEELEVRSQASLC